MSSWNDHVRAATCTIVIEDQNGDAIDLDALDALLREHDIKIRVATTGDHTIAEAVLRQTLERLDSAKTLIGACLPKRRKK